MILTKKDRKEIRSAAKRLPIVTVPRKSTITYSKQAILAGQATYHDLDTEGENWKLVEKTFAVSTELRTKLLGTLQKYFKIETVIEESLNHKKELTKLIEDGGWQAGQEYINEIEKLTLNKQQ